MYYICAFLFSFFNISAIRSYVWMTPWKSFTRQCCWCTIKIVIDPVHCNYHRTASVGRPDICCCAHRQWQNLFKFMEHCWFKISRPIRLPTVLRDITITSMFSFGSPVIQLRAPWSLVPPLLTAASIEQRSDHVFNITSERKLINGLKFVRNPIVQVPVFGQVFVFWQVYFKIPGFKKYLIYTNTNTFFQVFKYRIQTTKSISNASISNTAQLCSYQIGLRQPKCSEDEEVVVKKII